MRTARAYSSPPTPPPLSSPQPWPLRGHLLVQPNQLRIIRLAREGHTSASLTPSLPPSPSLQKNFVPRYMRLAEAQPEAEEWPEDPSRYLGADACHRTSLLEPWQRFRSGASFPPVGLFVRSIMASDGFPANFQTQEISPTFSFPSDSADDFHLPKRVPKRVCILPQGPLLFPEFSLTRVESGEFVLGRSINPL